MVRLLLTRLTTGANPAAHTQSPVGRTCMVFVIPVNHCSVTYFAATFQVKKCYCLTGKGDQLGRSVRLVSITTM